MCVVCIVIVCVVCVVLCVVCVANCMCFMCVYVCCMYCMFVDLCALSVCCVCCIQLNTTYIPQRSSKSIIMTSECSFHVFKKTTADLGCCFPSQKACPCSTSGCKGFACQQCSYLARGIDVGVDGIPVFGVSCSSSDSNISCEKCARKMPSQKNLIRYYKGVTKLMKLQKKVKEDDPAKDGDAAKDGSLSTESDEDCEPRKALAKKGRSYYYNSYS